MADLAYTHGVWRQTLQGLHKTRKNFIDPEIHLTTENFKTVSYTHLTLPTILRV